MGCVECGEAVIFSFRPEIKSGQREMKMKRNVQRVKTWNIILL